MSLISNTIEQFILSLLQENGIAELQRNEMAQYFSCAPSQINYVLTTRFSPERGYMIESRRGGGGYIRIMRMEIDKDTYLQMLLTKHLGSSISYQYAEGIINNLLQADILMDTEAELMLAAVCDRTLHITQPARDTLRADILKAMLIAKNHGLSQDEQENE